MARIFTEAKKNGHPPRRNILFLNVSGEEKGLLGSSWFVDHPAIPLKNIVANINIDMIGRTDQRHDSIGEAEYVYIIGADMTSSELKIINEEQNSIGPKLVLDYTYNSKDDPNRYYQRSDHYNFLKNQIPIIFYFNGAHVDYHQPTDTPDKINFSLLKKRTQLAFLTAWELANREKRPVIDKLDESGQ
jgi:Zn-dependent M28 family amino/carboxypeptidase